jgi:putative ABC transport system ATP-binding protein
MAANVGYHRAMQAGAEASVEPSPAAVARLAGVGKVYGQGEEQVRALAGIDVQIPAGAFTMVVGPSGCGKTTLLNLVGCIDRPSAGTVEVRGQRVAELDDDALSDFRAAHIGFVFQHFSLVPVLTTFENVEQALLLLDVPRAERRERVLAMLDAVGLAGKAQTLPGQLSGGQKQRVGIARALVKQPALVLADEPTANLDRGTSLAIVELMRTMQQRLHTSFVICTHDPQLMSFADHFVRLVDGRIDTAGAGA